MRSLASLARDLSTHSTVAALRTNRAVRYTTDLIRRGVRELSHNEAFEMAAGLTYYTIFSLIPLLVLSLIVFRAFGGLDEQLPTIRAKAYELIGLPSLSSELYLEPNNGVRDEPMAFENAGPDAPFVDPYEEHAPQAPGAMTPAERQAAEARRQTIDEIITELTEQVAQMNFGGVAGAGLVLFIWMALRLVVSIEYAFNKIYNCSQGRSWSSRIINYWSVITLGGALLFVTLYLAARLTDWVAGLGLLTGVVWVFSRLMGLVATWLLLFLLYVRMPNTRVQVRAAAFGALIAAILWEMGKWSFGLYVTRAVPYHQFYGALGLLPLFLFWLYIGWVIVLLGLELAFTVQASKSGRFKHAIAAAERAMFYDARSLIPMMAMIGAAFRRGGSVEESEIARELETPLRGVAIMAAKLQEAGLIHRVEGDDDGSAGYVLARAPDAIRLSELLALSRQITSGRIDGAQQPVAEWMARLSRAQEEAAGNATLSRLLDTEPQPHAPRAAPERGAPAAPPSPSPAG